MKVSPVLNEFGKVVKNQYSFNHKGSRFFQSYDNIVARVDQNNGAIQLDEKYYDASKTTAKYRNIFLNMSTSKIRTGIEDGSIKVVNLNE